MSYQEERDRFIARMAQEGLPVHVTRALLRAATTLQRYAELACSSEQADRDRVPCPALKSQDMADCVCDNWPNGELQDGHERVTRIAVQGDRLERRIASLITSLVTFRNGARAWWAIDTQGDPRGYVLRVIPPSYAERNADRDRFNLDTIGVPARESGLRF